MPPPLSEDDRPTAGSSYVNLLARNAAPAMRSEFIAEAEAQIVGAETDVLHRHEPDVLPLATHEQAAPHGILQAETGGPTSHQAVGPSFGLRLRARNQIVRMMGGNVIEYRVSERIKKFAENLRR